MGQQSSVPVKTEGGEDIDLGVEATTSQPPTFSLRTGRTKTDKMDGYGDDRYSGYGDESTDGIVDFELPDLPPGLPMFSSQAFLDDEPTFASYEANNAAFGYNSQLTNVTSPGSSTKRAKKERLGGSSQGERSVKKKKRASKHDGEEDREARRHKRKSKRKSELEGIDSDPLDAALPTPATTATRSRSAFDDSNDNDAPHSEMVIPTSQPPSRKRKPKFLFGSERKKKKKRSQLSEEPADNETTDVCVADESQEVVQDTPTDPIIPDGVEEAGSNSPLVEVKGEAHTSPPHVAREDLSFIIRSHYQTLPRAVDEDEDDADSQKSPTAGSRSRSRSRSRSSIGSLPIGSIKQERRSPSRSNQLLVVNNHLQDERLSQRRASDYQSDSDDNPGLSTQDAVLQNLIEADQEEDAEAQDIESHQAPLSNGSVSANVALITSTGEQDAASSNADGDTTSSSGSSGDDVGEAHTEGDKSAVLGRSNRSTAVPIESSGEEADDELMTNNQMLHSNDEVLSAGQLITSMDEMEVDGPNDDEYIEHDSKKVGDMAHRSAIQKNLESVESPMVRDADISEIDELPSSAHKYRSSSRGSSRKTPGKRQQRPKPTFFEQPETEVDEVRKNLTAFAELPSAEAVGSPKPTKASRKPKAALKAKLSASMRKENQGVKTSHPKYQPGIQRDGFITGAFNEDELEKIRVAVEQFRDDHRLTQKEVNTMIQASARSLQNEMHVDLWVQIVAACPDRRRQKIINVTRKNFHNFTARGAWTDEQSEELEKMIRKYGEKWSEIGHVLNRHPEDIRDRYRNYIICGRNRERSKWTEDEEALLVENVIKCIKGIDKSRSKSPNKVGLRGSSESLIDWQTVSQGMGRTRSRLQCMNKWKNMHIKVSGNDVVASQQPTSTVNWRLEKARKQIRLMATDDKHRLVEAIRRSAAGKDNKIPWTKLVDKPYRMKWHKPTLVLLWHRLKQSVPDNDKKTVRDCSSWLLEKYEQDEVFHDARDSEVDDEEEMEFLDPPKRRQTKKSTSRGKGRISDELVVSSDEEEDEDDAAGNSPNNLPGNDDDDFAPPSRTNRWLESVDASNEPEQPNAVGTDQDRSSRSRRSSTDATGSSINADLFKIKKSATAVQRHKNTPLRSHTTAQQTDEDGEEDGEGEESGEASSEVSSDTDMADIRSIPARLSSAHLA